AMHHPSTLDRRSLIKYVTEPATGRSLAVCAARDDSHQNANFTTRRFEVEDFAKQIPSFCSSRVVRARKAVQFLLTQRSSLADRIRRSRWPLDDSSRNARRRK